MRGYFGIGIYQAKNEHNIGTLWRSAHCFGANFIFTVGRRYRRQPSDCTNAALHVPLFEYASLDDFEQHKPLGCETVCVEIHDGARQLHVMAHPVRAAYLLGPEDGGLPPAYMANKQVVQIPATTYCLNVAVAGAIVLYDRAAKRLCRSG